jgi:AraC family transcriptional regulator
MALEGAIERYLSECFAREETPRACELAARCGLSPAQFTRALLRERGMRPADYLKARQVELARRLLETTDLNTTAIAYRAGFGTRATFFRVFRRITGETPAQFRHAHHPEAA